MVDLLLWLTGDTVKEVLGRGNRIAARDTAFGENDFTSHLLVCATGLIARISANFGCVHPHHHNLAVYGTGGTFLNRADAGLLFRSRDQKEPELLALPYPGYEKGDLIPDFLDAIIADTQPEVTAEDIFAALSVCFAMEKAVRSGQPVQVTYL